MTTLESRYNQCLMGLQGKRSRPNEVSQEEVDYIIATMPFIKEYTSSQPAPKPSCPASKSNIGAFVTITHKSNAHQVFCQYMMTVENIVDPRAPPVITRVEQDETCKTCNKPMVLNSRESDLVCTGCGLVRSFMDMSTNTLTYDQQVQSHTFSNYFAYKRLNHFLECLNALQAKENTEIPTEVLEAVRAEFKKARVTKRGDIKPSRVHDFLRKLKLTKYYEHRYSICNALNGVPAPRLPQCLEDKLKHMFGEIQEPFEKWCPPKRKNFLSYDYVLFKFCELLGEDEYLEYFSLLKSSDKLYVQDSIWKNICKELKWEFIRSV